MIVAAKNKRLPPMLLTLLVYVGYCASSWYGMRGRMAYYGEMYGWSAWFANDIWAFFLGGILPVLLFEFIANAVMRMLTAKVGVQSAAAVRYGMNFVVFASSVICFGLGFINLAAPMYAALLQVLIEPTVTILATAVYLAVLFRRNTVEKSLFRVVLVYVMGAVLFVYGVLCVVNLVSVVTSV